MKGLFGSYKIYHFYWRFTLVSCVICVIRVAIGIQLARTNLPVGVGCETSAKFSALSW